MGYRMTVMPKKGDKKIRRKKKGVRCLLLSSPPSIVLPFWVADTFQTGVDVTSPKEEML